MSATHTGDRQRGALATLSQLARQLRRCRSNGGDLSLVPQVLVDILDCYKVLLYQYHQLDDSLSIIATSRPLLLEQQAQRLAEGRMLASEVLLEGSIAVGELKMIPGEGLDETCSQWIACPILNAESRLLGVLEAELPRSVEATERHLFQLAADLLADHVGQVDMHDRIFRSNVYLAHLNDITQLVSSQQEVDAMVEVAATGLQEMMGVDEIALYLIEEAVPLLTARGGTSEALPEMIRVTTPEGDTILGSEEGTQVPIGTSTLDGGHILTELLRTGSGGARGILLLHKSKASGPFDPEQLPLLSALSTHLCTAVDNATLLREIHRQATYDDLTGLVGRRHFLSEMKRERERARREGRPLSLLMIDADNFKALNDNHGHPAGDAVLMALAQELVKGTRAGDLVGRLGGEEVAVLLPGATNELAVIIAERLRSGVQQLKIPWNGKVLGVTVSIGATTLSANMSAMALLEQADQALYAAKEAGRDRVVSQYKLEPIQAEGS